MLMVLTSSSPIKNSAQNISNSTLKILKEEFQRGYNLFEKEKQNCLNSLVEKYDFFGEFNNFVVVTVSALDHESFLIL